MISDEGHPILFDFGSAIPARIPIPNRSVALTQQDIAAEHSSMPFRACELFEVQVGTPLDEKVDIWSLGCTLFALAYGTSPFETNAGDSIVMAVRNGQYKFPANDQVYSQGLKDLISSMLVVDPQKRPDIHEVSYGAWSCHKFSDSHLHRPSTGSQVSGGSTGAGGTMRGQFSAPLPLFLCGCDSDLSACLCKNTYSEVTLIGCRARRRTIRLCCLQWPENVSRQGQESTRNQGSALIPKSSCNLTPH